MKKRAIIIGSGFSGLSAAASLAQRGYQVTVLEKNEGPGGRASLFHEKGFTFDMGPSWYWMPDVFEQYFQSFGREVADYYELELLDPGYRVYFGQNDELDIPAGMEKICALFEQIEAGSGEKLKKFLAEAGVKYERGINDLVHRPSHSIMEFMDPRLLREVTRLDLFTSIRKHVHRSFKNDKLRKILEFPVYFLGALPENTPALYSLMNYADLVLGTWYPKGGMHKIVEGMVAVAEEFGVEFHYNQNVKKINVANGTANSVETETHVFEGDVVVASADYHHVEQHLLEKKYRTYTPDYWDKRVMAPSSLIYFLGVNKRLKNLKHHNLFFDQSFEQFGKEIYETPKWPESPLFYVCCPSQTDETVAPEGCENLFVLIPTAPGLEDTPEIRAHYYDLILARLEKLSGQSIRDSVVYKRSFAHKDFKNRYNAFKGNAYGLANTLMQTAVFKPKMKSKKVNNLYYTGQLTVPGPGVPPSIISGQVVAKEIAKKFGEKPIARPQKRAMNAPIS